MSNLAKPALQAIPAQLDFLAIYNPSLSATDDNIQDQIVYYHSPKDLSSTGSRGRERGPSGDDALRERRNGQLRQIGLAQGMVEFGKNFAGGKSVNTVETEKSRIILHELESGWWVLASINLTILPQTLDNKDATTNNQGQVEYSSREVKPPIILLGDLLKAHSTLLLHQASSLSALFVRTKRSKFLSILARYWDNFLSTWNVMMHGNPANSLYGGIKIAACGELGIGVGEEERGSGEREVLEGLLGRIDGLVDVMVSKFGDSETTDHEAPAADGQLAKPIRPWLGSGNSPAADDGIIFLGTGALSRKSLRDVSHWMEDLYQWGPHAYGVMDNSSSTRRKKTRRTISASKATAVLLRKSGSAHASNRAQDSRDNTSPLGDLPTAILQPPPPIIKPPSMSSKVHSAHTRNISSPPLLQMNASGSSPETDLSKNKYLQYLKMGYGTHWTLGGSTAQPADPADQQDQQNSRSGTPNLQGIALDADRRISKDSNEFWYPNNDTLGHYLIGLLGDIEIENDTAQPQTRDHQKIAKATNSVTSDNENDRIVLRTVTVELERKEDARPEANISIDLGTRDIRSQTRSTFGGSDRTGTSLSSFEDQDRNKTKKLRVVVYVNKPFMFVFLFEVTTDALALNIIYRSLHYQIAPLLRPLRKSTRFRQSNPQGITNSGGDTSKPIYDLIWDPKLLTIHSSIPDIPDPVYISDRANDAPWSRIEALNTHLQIINTYQTTSTNRSELERTCKTSRNWWVVWNRIPSEDSLLPTPPAERAEHTAKDKASAISSGLPSPGVPSASMTNYSVGSASAHPYIDFSAAKTLPKDKEIFLIRRASDNTSSKISSRITGRPSIDEGSSWIAGPGKFAQGIGVDTKRYIEGLLSLTR